MEEVERDGTTAADADNDDPLILIAFGFGARDVSDTTCRSFVLIAMAVILAGLTRRLARWIICLQAFIQIIMILTPRLVVVFVLCIVNGSVCCGCEW